MNRLLKAATCEFIGTAFLLATVVGSGILAHKLDAGNVAVSVLAVAFATGTVLTALILAFGSISCHFNPIVTLASAIRKEFSWSWVIPFFIVQIAGAAFGVVIANLMFDLPGMTIASTPRSGFGQWLGEFVATFGLLGVIFGTAKSRASALPFAVGAYVAGAIWFTSSTCFANPAVTIARALTDTLTGIRPTDVAAFIYAQGAGATAALIIFGWLFAADQAELSKRQELDRLYEKEPASVSH
ncbi:MAG: aquaporin family protein [Candidatus Obscuribacterales bacterium]|nr:aquaporin family protein [Candidatus Obscuribacterales bacterium]